MCGFIRREGRNSYGGSPARALQTHSVVFTTDTGLSSSLILPVIEVVQRGEVVPTGEAYGKQEDGDEDGGHKVNLPNELQCAQ